LLDNIFLAPIRTFVLENVQSGNYLSIPLYIKILNENAESLEDDSTRFMSAKVFIHSVNGSEDFNLGSSKQYLLDGTLEVDFNTTE
jgi:hypothetical protein